jgi:hypothetical protein
MRLPSITLAGLVAGAFAASPAVAQPVVYHGALTCEAATTVNIRASSVRSTVTVAGSQVTFQRPIFNQDTRTVIGREQGTGTLANGRFVIETTGDYEGRTMRGRYEGALSGGEVTLSGTRQWTLRSGTGTQACTGRFRPQAG